MTRLPTPHRPRRLLRRGIVTLGLVAAALVPVGLGVPSVNGAEDCLSEAASGIGSQRCDDQDPPSTTITAVSPRPNSHDYLRTNQISISFTGAYDDADTDPIVFECQFYESSTAPTDWKSCTSPYVAKNLPDTTDTPYTFQVRAVDQADNAIDATKSTFLGPTGAATDLPDYDQTPAGGSFYVDTTAPNTFIVGGPYDTVTPDFPMVHQPSVTYDLESSETNVRYACRLDGATTACANGDTTFDHLRPGDHTLAASTSDLAGNVDATPARTTFSVPRNLTAGLGQGWKQVAQGAASASFGHDVLEATKPGATLSVTIHRVTDLRVIAPRGPGLGTIEYKLGRFGYKPLRQKASSSQEFAVPLQHFFVGPADSKITFRVLKASPARPAELDAILLH